MLCESINLYAVSAKLSEGLFYSGINMLAHASEVPDDCVIGNTDDYQAIVFEESGAPGVLFHVFALVVLRTVQFNYEFRFRTVEVCNIVTEHLLSGKPDRVSPKKIIP